MKHIAKILALFVVLLFTGCSADSPGGCKAQGWKGLVIYSNKGDIYCSNGQLTPSKKEYLTSNGIRSVALTIYYEEVEVAE